MNVIITGVAGFIGSNLAMKLVEKNIKVTGIDNLSYGHERNLQSLKERKNFTFIYGNLSDKAILKDIPSDVVVHLASQKIPRYTNALRTLDENYLMLRNVVEKCKKSKARLVFASTSDVYGKNPNLPFSEESDLVMGPTTVKRWAYALSKIYGEHYIIANSQEFGLEYSIARFFGSFGPHQNLSWWGGPQSVFIEKALKGEVLEVHGDGTQSRTFTYIDDTIDGLLNLVLKESAAQEIFNIGAAQENEITIVELAVKIWKMIHGNASYPEIELIPYETFGKYEDVSRRVPDISKMKSFFNYQPSCSLDYGLEKTIIWRKTLNL